MRKPRGLIKAMSYQKYMQHHHKTKKKNNTLSEPKIMSFRLLPQTNKNIDIGDILHIWSANRTSLRDLAFSGAMKQVE